MVSALTANVQIGNFLLRFVRQLFERYQTLDTKRYYLPGEELDISTLALVGISVIRYFHKSDIEGKGRSIRTQGVIRHIDNSSNSGNCTRRILKTGK